MFSQVTATIRPFLLTRWEQQEYSREREREERPLLEMVQHCWQIKVVIHQPIIYHSWPCLAITLLKCNFLETYCHHCHHCTGARIIFLNKSLKLRLERGQKMKNELINSAPTETRNIWFLGNFPWKYNFLEVKEAPSFRQMSRR